MGAAQVLANVLSRKEMIMKRNNLSHIQIDLSDQKDLNRYLYSSLTVSGTSPKSWPTQFTKACQWYADLVGLGFGRIPFFLVHDLGFLFLFGNQFPFRILNPSVLLEEGEEDKRALRASYENRVLNRILSLPIFFECLEALEEKGKRNEVVVSFLERILEPLKDLPLPSILATPSAIRSGSIPTLKTPEDSLKELEEILVEGFPEEFFAGDQFSFCEMQCQVVSEAFEMIPLSKYLGPEDVFIARHFEILGGRAQRIIARQISEFEGKLGVSPPPPAGWVPETPEVKVDLEDAGYFPQGGLDEMANRGSFENLVQSQLAFVDKTEDIDLFSLRYVEGELLYYTRDDGQLLRRSRAIHIFFEMGEEYEFHYPGQPARLSILLRSFLNRFVEDLFSVFESDSLRIILHVIGSSSSQNQELSEFWRIRFSERVEKGELKIEVEKNFDLKEIPSPYVVPGRISSVVYLGPKNFPGKDHREQQYRSNLAVYWAKLDLEKEGDWRVLENTSSTQWSFDLGVSTNQIVPALTSLKTQLVWRNFGS